MRKSQDKTISKINELFKVCSGSPGKICIHESVHLLDILKTESLTGGISTGIFTGAEFLN